MSPRAVSGGVIRLRLQSVNGACVPEQTLSDTSRPSNQTVPFLKHSAKKNDYLGEQGG